MAVRSLACLLRTRRTTPQRSAMWLQTSCRSTNLSNYRERTSSEASVRILSVGTALPKRRISNDQRIEEVLTQIGRHLSAADLDRLDSRLRWVLKTAGAEYRYLRGQGERAVDLGIEAGLRAIEMAGLHKTDIDLLVYVGVGKGLVEPASANVFQHELGLSSATCFDVSDACAAWLRGVDIAHHLLRSGQYRNAMILNCEFNVYEYGGAAIQRMEDLPPIEAGVTVGEAATATVLSGDKRTGDDDFYASFRNNGQHLSACIIPLPQVGQYVNYGTREPAILQFRVDTKSLHRHVLRQLHSHYQEDKRIHSFNPDLIVIHAVGAKSALLAIKRLKMENHAFADSFPRYGNTVSASMPLTLADAIGEGRVSVGTRILFAVGSAGVTTGFATFTF